MSEFCFSFLENQFRDIYLDCARMDKNLIEGDGVESILIAGRIAEKVTKAIFDFESIREVPESQYKRIQMLANANILPNNIKNDLSNLRRLRNDVYHNNIAGDGAGGFKNSRNQPVKSYVQRGGLRDYKTGFNKKKDYSIKSSSSSSINSSSSSKDSANSKKSGLKTNSNFSSNYSANPNSSNFYDFGGEIAAAKEAHRVCFNICVWFYVNYSGDRDFVRPKYKLSRRTQDADFLLRLKAAINDGDEFVNLRKSNPNSEIIQILNEIYVKPIKEEKKEENVSYGVNNAEFKIRKPGVPYSQCLGISYDDDFFMWKAEHGTKELGLFESSKEAYEAREKYIHSLPMPKMVDGDYSKARGISFSKLQKLWTASVKGQIISYHENENDAIKARKDYLKKHNLIDVKVKGGFRTITPEQKKKLEEKAKINAQIKIGKKERENELKTISSSSNIKNELTNDLKKLIGDTKSDLASSSGLSYDSSSASGSSSSKSLSTVSSVSQLDSSSKSDSANKNKSKAKSKTESKSKSISKDDLKDNSKKNDLMVKSTSKSNSSDSSTKKDLQPDSNRNKLAYAEEFKKDKKVHVVNGMKVSAPNKEIKKIKVIGGNRVSDKSKSKSKAANASTKRSNFGSKNKSKNKNKAKSKSRTTVEISKKKSSKYEGVYYEEGLFMWSAELDGKHLGLYASEEEAHNKREEYIKSRNS
ncbi:hypothetical protein [uncultured Methanobrevibacter sp.]|uniref:hypothetical protein n=1 Tax=uncultured Methanobrevibacter sp. TaxID=253161 RepID=UPI00263825B7